MNKTAKQGSAPLVRCAVYTRKSTEEGLEQAFNSLDAQREASEAYIASQKNEGWTCLPTRYDDGGFTGGNMDRPALKRLLADIEAGQVDAIIVYKLDRFSRSLLDFAKMMETFGQAPGRLRVHHPAVLHRHLHGPPGPQRPFVLRPVRARDHRRADAGQDRGHAPQGQVDRWHADPGLRRRSSRQPPGGQRPGGRAGAAIFALYLEHQALVPVVEELERRRWVNKRWRTKAGHERGGLGFTKTNLYAC